MRVGIVTSEKSVSLQKVARDVGFVLEESGFEIPKVILSPVADPFLYEDLDAIIVVMTFDTFWATPYFYLCWRFRREGRKCIFYTTIEGYPMRWHGDVWIYRDLLLFSFECCLYEIVRHMYGDEWAILLFSFECCLRKGGRSGLDMDF